MRWVTMRAQVLKGDKPGSRHAQGLRRIDQHLREVSHARRRSLNTPDFADLSHVAAMPAQAVIYDGGQSTLR